MWVKFTSKCFYIPNLANALANIFKFWRYSYSLFGFLLYLRPVRADGCSWDTSAKYPTPVPNCSIRLKEMPLYLKLWFSHKSSSVLLGIFFWGFILPLILFEYNSYKCHWFYANQSNINTPIKDWSTFNQSPTEPCCESFYMLLFFLQFLLDFYSPIKDRAVEILANNLITEKSLAVIAFGCHFTLLFLQSLTLIFFLQVNFHFLVFAVFAYYWFRLPFAPFAGFSFCQETSQCTFLIYFWCIS